MPAPESQLATWSHQGSIAQSSATYQSIKSALEVVGTPIEQKSFEVFLQGSYGNDTNIYAESDVDIVVKLNNVWQKDLSSLSEREVEAYNNYFAAAQYGYADFKRDVASTLARKYGSSVTLGDKAIAIAPGGGRRKADVIAAIEYRRYFKFNGVNDQRFECGICIYNSKGERIANYPRQHSANLTKKHQESGEWLKPMVRIFKNLRSRLIEERVLDAKAAPSYYLEGLLYNVPKEAFGGTYQDTFSNILDWLQEEADESKFVCANEQYYLLWDNSHTSWGKANYKAFISAVARRWNK